MSALTHPIRKDRVQQLVEEALETMAQPDVTSGELASACFTLCLRIIDYSINVKDPVARERNIETARTAIGQLYSQLPAPRSVN
jgi:hypothetical protein